MPVADRATPALQRPSGTLTFGAGVAAVSVFVGALYRPLLSRTAIMTDEQYWPYLRAGQYLAEFRAGHLPQLFPEALRGGGYAFPYFYPPFSQYVAAACSWIAGDVVIGVHTALLLSVWLAAIAMLWAVRDIGTRLPSALFAAVLYTAMPYRWADIMGRGAAAESWTFVWYPLIIAGAWRVWRGRTMPWWLPVSIAGLLLSHAVMSLYFAMTGVLVLALCWGVRGEAAVAQLAVAVGLGSALAAWHLFPSQLALHTVRAGDPGTMGALPAAVAQVQLAARQTVGLAGLAHGGGINLGAIQLLLPFLIALAPRLRGSTGGRMELAVACFLCWLLWIAVIVQPAPFFAIAPAKLAYIQFPWRLLGITALLASLALAVLLDGARELTVMGLTAGVAVGAFVLSGPPAVHWPGMTQATIAELSPTVGDSGYTVQGEYVPRHTDHTTLATAIAAGPSVTSGIAVTRWSNGTMPSVDVVASIAGRVTLPVVAYPFLRATLNGKPVGSDDDGGRLSVMVPVGVSRISVRRRVPIELAIGIVVSLVGLVALAVPIRQEATGGHPSRVQTPRRCPDAQEAA